MLLKRRRPGLARPDEPLATVEAVDGVRRLAAVDPAAASRGLRSGQKLADARAVLPALKIADADPRGDLAGLVRLAEWADRFTPAVALDPPDGLLLDIAGCQHLWGGERALVDDLLAGLARRGIPARVATAATFGAAWAVARHAEELHPLLPPGGERDRLVPLPVAALRPAAETLDAAHRLGLDTIGQLLAMPRGALARRLGGELIGRLDRALGTAEEPILFRRPATPWFDRLAFAEPIADADDLARAAADIAARLCTRLADADRGGQRFILAFHRVDGGAARAIVTTALPSRDARRLAKLFRGKIETVDPGFGVEAVTLTADGVEPLAPAQPGLRHVVSGGADRAGLAPVIDTLANRLGTERLWRAAPQESHLPERAVRRIAPLAPDAGPWPPGRARPIRLFARPEAIEATAPVPDDPPVVFRWRGILHRVRSADGPERIGREWWREPALPSPEAEKGKEAETMRDYYRVEDEAGARYWIFREGLFAADASPPRWFLHGLFG